MDIQRKDSQLWRGTSDVIIRQLLKDLSRATNRTEMCEAQARFILASEERIAAFVQPVNNEVTDTKLSGNDFDMQFFVRASHGDRLHQCL